MQRIDPYNHERRFKAWFAEAERAGQIEDLSADNSQIILRFIRDMRDGINISVQKGKRSFCRLNTLRGRLIMFTGYLERIYPGGKLQDLKSDELITIFNRLRTGEIRTRKRNKTIRDTDTMAKIVTSFWHWYQKIQRQQGRDIPDITQDLDKNHNKKPRWVYLNDDQFKRLFDHALHHYKVLLLFLKDSGVRSPGELVNLRVSDLEWLESRQIYELNIRDEISKTFGRRIKLMLCSKLLREFLKEKGLSGDDQLFPICMRVVNQYLKRLARKVLGDGVSKAGERYSEISLYDFRHISCCYWYPRYKSESALKYRFGWKQSDKIHYYSEFLGMQDTITEQDLLIDVSATELERQLMKERQARELLEERFNQLDKDRDRMFKQFNEYLQKIEIFKQRTSMKD